MTYSETVAVVYRVIGAYPFYTRHLSDEMLEDMAREWHEGLKSIPPDGVMEAVTALITEQKWMPTLAEIISKILDIQYGTEQAIIKDLDRLISRSSNCIIFGQVTEEQEQGYKELSNFHKLIVRSPHEFNLWLMKDYEWKEDRVKRVKREIQTGKHQAYLNGKKDELNHNFDIFKALEERKHGQNQQ